MSVEGFLPPGVVPADVADGCDGDGEQRETQQTVRPTLPAVVDGSVSKYTSSQEASSTKDKAQVVDKVESAKQQHNRELELEETDGYSVSGKHAEAVQDNSQR